MKRTILYNSNTCFVAFAMGLMAVLTACQKKSDGYLLDTEAVTKVIQISTGEDTYSIKSVPDVITFSTTAVNANLPNYRQYTVRGTSVNGNLNFTVQFHVDTLGSGHYVLEGSQLMIGSKTYISLASKTTDKVRVTKIDDKAKTYAGNFTFYSLNKALATDSVLVTGSYSIQY